MFTLFFPQIYLVGRSLKDGSQIWQSEADPMGLPVVYNGRLFAVSTQSMMAMESDSGAVIWSVPAVPSPDYSYGVTPTFGNDTGLLVASRCLGQPQQGLCMYSAFAPPPSGAYSVRMDFGAVWAASLAVAMLVQLLTDGSSR